MIDRQSKNRSPLYGLLIGAVLTALLFPILGRAYAALAVHTVETIIGVAAGMMVGALLLSGGSRRR